MLAWKMLLVVLLALAAAAGQQQYEGDDSEKLRQEYESLYERTDDKVALEAIRDLHKQLDEDNDGTIEPSETGEFMRGELYQGSGHRGNHFHDKDAEITVADLWVTWKHSEVFNWTSEQVADWVGSCVELPQYREYFIKAGVNGTQLPKVAASPQYLSRVVGISSPIHRSKLTLKAMDLVLFGSPKDHNFWKDTILTTLLVLAVSGLFYAYRQNKMSKGQLKKMMADLDSLSKAEETLKDLQDQLHQKDTKIESLSSIPSDLPDAVEISRLREELDILRSELQRAEVELEDKCWMAPPVLQHWLQLTYELESTVYNSKKKAAEEQLEVAKDMCDKLKRKRSSLVGAFVSTHGRSIDDVDKSILEAKTALMELTKDLTERSQRWRQIEMLCGCSITKNPGMSVLQSLVRHVGMSRGASAVPRLSKSPSQEDYMDEMDNRSVAGHSVASHSIAASHSVAASSHLSKHSAGSLSGQLKRRNELAHSFNQDAVKDSSSSSDEMMPQSAAMAAASHRRLQRPLSTISSQMQNQQQEVATTPPVVFHVADSPLISSPASDPPSLSPATEENGDNAFHSMPQSTSDGQIVQRPHEHGVLKRGGSSEGSALYSMGSVGMGSNHRKPSVVDETDELSISASPSESGSLAELHHGDGSVKERVKEHKKRSFFHFRKKKDKKALI